MNVRKAMSMNAMIIGMNCARPTWARTRRRTKICPMAKIV